MAIPTTVIISSKETYNYFDKITGLYILERNIMMLRKAGFKRIILHLSQGEKVFFEKHIKKRIKKFKVEVDPVNSKIVYPKSSLVICSNIFLQLHYFKDFDKYFNKEDNIFVPVFSDNIFTITKKSDIKRATGKVIQTILDGTGGFISRKINKSISIPISRLLVKTRIHPNYLTILNIGIGILSAYFMFLAAHPEYSHKMQYICMAISGLLFQTASVFDGVDGEIAKYSFKFTKLGGYLDTIGDNLTLLLFLIASSYLNIVQVGGYIAIISGIVLFTSLALTVGIMLRFINTRTDSGSLVAFDTYFLQKLPPHNLIVKFAKATKYLIKKEMFSIVILAACVIGAAKYILPGAAIVLLVSALTISWLFLRYRKNFPIKII